MSEVTLRVLVQNAHILASYITVTVISCLQCKVDLNRDDKAWHQSVCCKPLVRFGRTLPAD